MPKTKTKDSMLLQMGAPQFRTARLHCIKPDKEMLPCGRMNGIGRRMLMLLTAVKTMHGTRKIPRLLRVCIVEKRETLLLEE